MCIYKYRPGATALDLQRVDVDGHDVGDQDPEVFVVFVVIPL